MANNHKLIGHFCKIYHYTYEEVYDRLAIALCKCALTYDPTKNTVFSSYAFQGFRNEMSHYKKEKRALKRNSENGLLSLDYENINHNSNETFTLKDIIPDNSAGKTMNSKMYWNDFFLWAEKYLTKKEQEVLKYLIAGYRPYKIASILKVTRQAISSRINSLQNKMTKSYKETNEFKDIVDGFKELINDKI